jgi:N-acetylglucosaminyldiphosphoundecaprenol N-acetyl-beta-D-mannosaminyltransferase
LDNKVNILNVPFVNKTRQQILEELLQRIRNKEKTFVVTANPEIVMFARKDPSYFHTIAAADYIVADGIGIVIASKMLKKPLPERVAGFDLMTELLRLADRNRWKVFLLGAKEEVIPLTVENIKQKYPNLIIAGFHHGYFEDNDKHIVELVKESKADLVFVALGFPRQEKWIYEHYPLFDQGIFIGVGGSFDVLAGKVKRAPEIWQKLNIEWLYRLIQQPSRWRRMVALPQFLFEVIKNKKKQNP